MTPHPDEIIVTDCLAPSSHISTSSNTLINTTAHLEQSQNVYIAFFFLQALMFSLVLCLWQRCNPISTDVKTAILKRQ